jgi:dinuclear metal center YbgI/SA1388 family protein
MTTIAEIVAHLDKLAPPQSAEDWDNVGLLCGDPKAPCERIMTCLTVTGETAAEAAESGASLVLTHHPVLLRAVKSIRADFVETAAVWRLIRSGISVYSPHTAFDNAAGGINDLLAGLLELLDVEPLVPAANAEEVKIVVFCPPSDREPVLAAAFKAGAGQIGAYSECSFTSAGFGTFLGDETTTPTIGRKGVRERVREWRVELVCPVEALVPVLAAIRESHSYEEPAIDVYPLRALLAKRGAGRLGRLETPERLDQLATRYSRLLDAPGPQRVGPADRMIERVAIACGAGGEFLHEAARRGADLLVTGEVRYHQAIEAEARGLALIVAGHHATERPGVESLARTLAARFPALEVWASRRERDPLLHVSDAQKETPGRSGRG